MSPPVLRRLRRRGASAVQHAVLAGLIAIGVLGAVVGMGERIRSLFVSSEQMLGDGSAGSPQPPGDDGGSPPVGQGVWTGDGAFALSPLQPAETRTLTLTNTSLDGVLALAGAPGVSGPGAAAFQVVGGTCGATLGPGDGCSVQVQATASANGTATAVLAVPGVPGGLSLSRLATGFDPLLTWSGSGPINVSGAPGLGPLPRLATGVFVLQNEGFAPAAGIAPALADDVGGVFSILSSDCPATLAAGAVCTATVEARASSETVAETRLVAGGAWTAEVPVQMLAAGFAPQLAWSGVPTFAIDGTPGAGPLPRTVQRTFTLTNTGTAAADLAVGVSGAGFAPGPPSTTCTTTLAPNASCTFAVEASASANGTFSGTLSSGGAAPATQALVATASGFAAAWSWSDGGALTLDAPTGYPSVVTRTFTLTNIGTAAGAPPAPAATGGDLLHDVVLAGTTCAAVLEREESCTATVEARFRGDVAALSGILTAGDATLALTGWATGFSTALAFDPYDRETSSLSATTMPGPTRTFLLRNTGTGLLPVSPTPVLTGAGAAAFEIVGGTCGGALTPGEACGTQVRLAAGAPAGFHAATLEAGDASLAIDGAHAIPWLRLTSNLDSLTLPDIGNQTANPVVGTNVINLWNVGGAAISLAGFDGATTVTSTNTANLLPIGGGTLANRCEVAGSLPAGSHCALRVQRRATTNGTFTAVLGLTGIAGLAPGNVPSLPVSFTAAGLAPVPTIAHAPPDTRTVGAGVNSATFNRLFHNRGALEISPIAFTDFEATVQAQPPGGGLGVSIVTTPTAGRCGGTSTSLGAGASCNVAYQVTRPPGTTGTAQVLLRHLPSGTETLVTVNLN